MNIIYFDCSSGLSATACLDATRGALPDSGSNTRAGAKESALLQKVLDLLAGKDGLENEIKAVHDLLGLLDLLSVEKVYFSPVPLEKAPDEALTLLQGLPVKSLGGPVTFTGAALAGVLSRGEAPVFTLKSAGTGRGEGATVRAFFGAEDMETEEVAVLETAIDDLNPEHFPHITDLLLKNGALDVFLTPLIMKKGRPGTLLTVLAPPRNWSGQLGQILAHTSTLGVRVRKEARVVLPRRIVEVPTPYGPVQVKLSRLPGGQTRAKPEYEDCRALALSLNLPLDEVYRVVLSSTWRYLEENSPGD